MIDTAIDTTTVDAIIGSRIRLRRVALGLVQRDLCKLAGLSVGFMSDLENGKRGISAENLLAIAKALRVTPNYFFKPLLGKEGHGS